MRKTQNKSASLAVVGGGASGLIAAISAVKAAEKRNCSIKVTVYESNTRVGKKLLVTGNGRCNFSNLNIKKENFHGESELAFGIYRKFDNISTVDFFRSIGVYEKGDAAGRIYPMSFQASAVLDALRFEAQRLGIEFLTDTKITKIQKSGGGFRLNDCYYADACIVACGGKAASVHGSDGSGLEMLSALGVEVSPLFPALAPLVCERFNKGLKGVRAQGTVSIRCGGRVLAADTGELQYTEYGLSGIPSMQVSFAAAEALASARADVQAVVDSCPDFNANELKRIIYEIARTNPEMPNEMLLAGIMPKKLGAYLISECSVNPAKPIGRLHESVIEKIVTLIKNKKYKVTAVKGFSDAQVTAGGITAKEINRETLELHKLSGMYVCGEIVDVHGDCGGYNLQWAWSSGYVAGESAAKELLKCSE